jgi:[acyl-carrier-protein] S-malonyltransferase
MEEAGKKFEEVLKEFGIKDAVIPFVNNVDAKFLSAAADIRKSLVRQLSQSVLWEDCIKTIASRGIRTFVETGPGKVLSGLIKRIEPDALVFKVDNIESLNKTLGELA